MSMSMSFDLFKESMVQILQENLGKEYTVFTDNVMKNNGISLTGMIIRKNDKNASPTIYIDELYEEYQRGVSLKKLADTILKIYQENSYEEAIDLQKFKNYESAKEQIAFKVINKEKNNKLLQQVPHRTFYNLAVVFYYMVKEPPFYGKASVMITNAHLRHWKVDEEEFCQNAMKNTPLLLPAKIQNIEEVMYGLLKKEFTQEKAAKKAFSRLKEDCLGPDKIPMYVLSNEQKLHGAACMLYPDVIRNFAKAVNENLYILPSSIHEVILLTENAGKNKEELLAMVTEINATQVEESEVLADAVYFYHLKENRLEWID